MADDTPELGRLVVLHQALLEQIVTSLGVRQSPGWDAAAVELAKEADALTMRVAHRSRSAQNYQNTTRGMAALDDARQIVAALAAGEIKTANNSSGLTDSTWVEIVNYVWDKDQLDNPLAVIGGELPRRKIVRRWYVDPNLRFLSEELQPDYEPPPLETPS